MKMNSHSLLIGMQNSTATLGDNLAVHRKPDLVLPRDVAIAQGGIYPDDLKTGVPTKTCT